MDDEWTFITEQVERFVPPEGKYPLTLADAYDHACANKMGSPLSYQEFLASEGGRKCVECCRYRKQSDLYLRGHPDCGHVHGPGMHISISAQPVCGKCAGINVEPQPQPSTGNDKEIEG